MYATARKGDEVLDKTSDYFCNELRVDKKQLMNFISNDKELYGKFNKKRNGMKL